jgi:hypothetical protein
MNPIFEKIKITKDQLWKAVIQDFFEDFMYFFYPNVASTIDYENGCEFLDKELDQLYPTVEGKDRRADKLVKVRFKNGDEQALFIHIEVQGYYDSNFAERMFEYYYRIFDTRRVPLAAIAIYTDDRPKFHPKAYTQHLSDWGTLLFYRFKTYKLYDETIENLENQSNIFADVMLIAYHELKQNRPKTDEALLQLKTTFYRRLLEKGHAKERVRKMINFITYYTGFADPFYLKNLEQNFSKIDKTETTMGMDELILSKLKEMYREEIIEEVRVEMIEEVREEVIGKVRVEMIEEVREEVAVKERAKFISQIKEQQEKQVFRFFQKGFSADKTADLLDLEVEFVQQLFSAFRAGKTIGNIADQN